MPQFDPESVDEFDPDSDFVKSECVSESELNSESELDSESKLDAESDPEFVSELNSEF